MLLTFLAHRCIGAGVWQPDFSFPDATRVQDKFITYGPDETQVPRLLPLPSLSRWRAKRPCIWQVGRVQLRSAHTVTFGFSPDLTHFPFGDLELSFKAGPSTLTRTLTILRVFSSPLRTLLSRRLSMTAPRRTSLLEASDSPALIETTTNIHNRRRTGDHCERPDPKGACNVNSYAIITMIDPTTVLFPDPHFATRKGHHREPDRQEPRKHCESHR